MAVESLFVLVDLCNDAVARAATIITDALPLLEQSTASDADLGNLVAGIDGVRADIVTVRDDLDSTDMEDMQIHPEGAALIQLWAWERDVRHTLVLTGDALRESSALATTVRDGHKKKTRVLRRGETLQAIAQQELGDWKEWPRIVAVSGLDITQGNLPVGTVLTIPTPRVGGAR